MVYDAIVVGSGATGGVAAKTLGEQGLKVLVLEAGRDLELQDLGNDVTHMAKRIYNLSIAKTQSFQSLHAGYWKANPDFFVNELENPYTTPADRPFNWSRGRQVGGKSLTWGGITLRLSDYEFKAASRDGYGENWPIAYGDLQPYYDQLEQFFQVQGAADGLAQLPDGHYLAPAKLTPAEHHLKTAIETHWSDRQLIISRGFPLVKPTPDQPWPNQSSVGTSLKAALATGNVTLRSDAVVSHVVFDPETRLARGVAFIDRQQKDSPQKTIQEVQGRTVILCASTIESVRILLHSTAEHQPGGLANQGDLLGRHLLDHLATLQFFFLPGVGRSDQFFPLSGAESFFIPCFTNLQSNLQSNLKDQSLDFIRGYGIWGGIQRLAVPKILHRVGPGSIGFLIGHGETLPRWDNRVSLDPTVVDAWGIPAAHIDYRWSDNERAMATHMNQEVAAMVAQAGGECLLLPDAYYFLTFDNFVRQRQQKMALATPPGYYIHELGGARMGTAPTNSVVNSQNQCWDAPNVLVTDGACWTTAGWQSPTLTEMAITARACDLLGQRLRRGEL